MKTYQEKPSMKNIAVILAAIIITGNASWYSTEACRYNPDPKCPMANGESLYAAEARGENFAAAWFGKFGDRVKVCNKRRSLCTEVVITDRGPARCLHRSIDLSRRAFEEIATLEEGIIPVTVEVL